MKGKLVQDVHLCPTRKQLYEKLPRLKLHNIERPIKLEIGTLIVSFLVFPTSVDGHSQNFPI